jgi:ABC-type protease/lipase transport system fused ATPase/permease subunit
LRSPAFELPPGQILAVVGGNGSGKSTLARIVLGLWQADQGQVRWGGVALTQLAADELGARIGYLPQEVALFTATVAENIARLATVDSPQVVAAAQAAEVHELILSLPQGYDTLIGEGGMNLSGGQKQRIALARALYGQPDLLVLDEPDSHLDQQGREALVRILNALRERGVCTVVISHSTDLTRHADQILDLDRGVVESTAPSQSALSAEA